MSLYVRARSTPLAVASILLLLPLSACGSDDAGSTSTSARPTTSSMATTSGESGSAAATSSGTDSRITPVTITDGWAKAGEGPMSAAFGTLVNNSDQAVHITGATSPVARMELHEVAKNDAGAMVMRPVADGYTIDSGGKLVLEPGSFHIMFMELKEPLVNGESVTITLQTSLGEVPLSLPIRRFDGAGEAYEPSMDQSSMDHS